MRAREDEGTDGLADRTVQANFLRSASALRRCRALWRAQVPCMLESSAYAGSRVQSRACISSLGRSEGERSGVCASPEIFHLLDLDDISRRSGNRSCRRPAFTPLPRPARSHTQTTPAESVLRPARRSHARRVARRVKPMEEGPTAAGHVDESELLVPLTGRLFPPVPSFCRPRQ